MVLPQHSIKILLLRFKHFSIKKLTIFSWTPDVRISSKNFFETSCSTLCRDCIFLVIIPINQGNSKKNFINTIGVFSEIIVEIYQAYLERILSFRNSSRIFSTIFTKTVWKIPLTFPRRHPCNDWKKSLTISLSIKKINVMEVMEEFWIPEGVLNGNVGGNPRDINGTFFG